MPLTIPNRDTVTYIPQSRLTSTDIGVFTNSFGPKRSGMYIGGSATATGSSMVVTVNPHLGCVAGNTFMGDTMTITISNGHATLPRIDLICVVNSGSTIPSQSNITGNTVANPTVITTASQVVAVTGELVTITGSNSTPSINGTYVATFISSTTFSIPVNVTVSGTAGFVNKCISVIEGTPAANPLPPTFISHTTEVLYFVYVPAAATTISNSNLIDKRQQMVIGDNPFSSVAVLLEEYWTDTAGYTSAGNGTKTQVRQPNGYIEIASGATSGNIHYYNHDTSTLNLNTVGNQAFLGYIRFYLDSTNDTLTGRLGWYGVAPTTNADSADGVYLRLDNAAFLTPKTAVRAASTETLTTFSTVTSGLPKWMDYIVWGNKYRIWSMFAHGKSRAFDNIVPAAAITTNIPDNVDMEFGINITTAENATKKIKLDKWILVQFNDLTIP